MPFLALAKRADEAYKGQSDLIGIEAHLRYAKIMRYVEALIDDHSESIQGLVLACSFVSLLYSFMCSRKFLPVSVQKQGGTSRLTREVPGAGPFFTRLPLQAAFQAQDAKRSMSSRRSIPPSFHDIRVILNTAQLMAVRPNLQLATFDGDMTLYGDGECLEPSNPVIERLIS